MFLYLIFWKFRINLPFDFVTLTSSWMARFNVEIRECMWKNSKLSNENSIDIEKSLILWSYIMCVKLHDFSFIEFSLHYHLFIWCSSLPNLTMECRLDVDACSNVVTIAWIISGFSRVFLIFIQSENRDKNFNKYSSLSLHGLSWVSFTSLFALSPRLQHILCVKRVKKLCRLKVFLFLFFNSLKNHCCATALALVYIEINLVYSCFLFIILMHRSLNLRILDEPWSIVKRRTWKFCVF